MAVLSKQSTEYFGTCAAATPLLRQTLGECGAPQSDQGSRYAYPLFCSPSTESALYGVMMRWKDIHTKIPTYLGMTIIGIGISFRIRRTVYCITPCFRISFEHSGSFVRCRRLGEADAYAGSAHLFILCMMPKLICMRCAIPAWIRGSPGCVRDLYYRKTGSCNFHVCKTSKVD